MAEIYQIYEMGEMGDIVKTAIMTKLICYID